MLETSTARKLQSVVIAAIIAATMGFVLSLGAQKAYAADYEAGSVALTTQSQAPTITTPKAAVELKVGDQVQCTFQDGVIGQHGTWTVTSSDPTVAEVNTIKEITAQSTVNSVSFNVKGMKAGKATITGEFKTVKGVTGKQTIAVTVTESKTPDTPADTGAKVGTVVKKSGAKYKVTKNAAKSGKVTMQKVTNKKAKKFTIPATVKINGKKYTVAGIAAKAFKGTKVKKVTVKTKSLTKKTVKNCFKGSKVKKVIVKADKNKAKNKKVVKKYKNKVLTKKITGKKVTVK